jgi:hypothetical protein
MKTNKPSSLTADEIGTIRLTPDHSYHSALAYTIPPPPINSQYSYQSNIILLNIDWSRVPPYRKNKKSGS